MQEVARDVNDPVSGKSLLDEYLAKAAKAAPARPAEFHIGAARFRLRLYAVPAASRHRSLNLGFDNEREAASIIPLMTISTGSATSKTRTFVYGRALAQ